MQQQESDTSKDGPFISIRKLAALDIVWHGYKLILAEFLLTVGLSSILAVFSFSFFIRTSTHPLFALILSLVFLWVALNYVPLLLYALHFASHKTAELEVAFELAHKERYIQKYQLQSLLLFVPLVIPILAIVQAW
ncbi:MAG TPA: hypothetical protein VH593_17940, partial [Ktedonobacteraceae bacterium]